MSYGTPPRIRKPSVNDYQRRCEAVGEHPFTIDEIADLVNKYLIFARQDGILFGSAAVWVYATKYGFTREDFKILNLTGVGSDVDILVKDTLKDDNLSRIIDSDICRQIDIVDVAKMYQGENANFKRKRIMDQISTSIIVGNRIIPIITPIALTDLYISRRDTEKITKEEKDKIQMKIDILEDVQAIMSTRPETETDDVAYAHFKF